MSERYQRWLQIFKQLNEHSPTKEDIDLIAPSHIKEEYLKLHAPEKVIPKPIPKVKLKRSFDKRDCLPEVWIHQDGKEEYEDNRCLITLPDDEGSPHSQSLKKIFEMYEEEEEEGSEPVLKKHRVDVTNASGCKALFQTKDSSLLRRSPRKHPSSSLVRPTTPGKISSFKPVARRSLTNMQESEIFQNVERPIENKEFYSTHCFFHSKRDEKALLYVAKYDSLYFIETQNKTLHFVIQLATRIANSDEMQPGEQILRRSPRKHPSSYNEVLLSPQKPLLLSQPIVCRRLSSLLGSISDIENEKESITLNSSLESISKEENDENLKEDSQESNNACAEEEQQPFLDEKECLKRKTRRKNENYRRLKMKKSYVHGTSLAKKNFRKWRRTRNKR
ncbi:hypothetical protein LOAG_06648 [Loa loa]|uniref:Uncharacterized protein n=1 Tax=Loa loa TaxID=7209 RepID=A0A1S0TXE0_LOALO|nr:hypothetical protein LOAG_06648 [Loa loa]EFO21835.1 hypothetical protein LOAG_06648 [Loa loa]